MPRFQKRLILSSQWDDLYASMATALAKRKVISDDTVSTADDKILEGMAQGLGCTKDLVSLMVGGT